MGGGKAQRENHGACSPGAQAGLGHGRFLASSDFFTTALQFKEILIQ
jgi:hypothetical protein